MSEEKDKNLINFIAAAVETMRDQMATKEDLAAVNEKMATKNDVARVEAKLDAKTTAIRGDIERVQLRLDSIDHALSTRMESY